MVVHVLKNWVKKISWAQALVAGVCLGIGFIVPTLWWLGVLSIVWLIYILHSDASYKKIIGIYAVVWGIKALCSIIWFWSALPIDWVDGMSTVAQVSIVTTYWLTSGLWLCSGGILFAAVSVWLLRQSLVPHFIVLLLLPGVWLLAELCAASVFSVFTAGPGSFVQTYFSFGMVGYLFGITPGGVWLSAGAGVYGLTLVMVTLAMLLYVVSQKQSLRMTSVLSVLLYVIVTYGSLPTTNISPVPVRVIAVDTQFDAEFLGTDVGLLSKNASLKAAVTAATLLTPEVILLPEDSRYLVNQFDGAYPNQAMSMFQFTHANTESVIIDSGRYTNSQGVTVVRANVFDGISKKLWQFDKQYLVPQGEYVPTVYALVLRLLGYGDVVDAIAADSAYRPGPLTQTPTLPEYLPAVLFCFESVSPSAGHTLRATRNIPFIAHPVSHAWFHTPTILWHQLDVMLQLQARYSGVPIVSAGNMTTGKLYLPSGEIKTGTVVGSGERYVLKEFQF